MAESSPLITRRGLLQRTMLAASATATTAVLSRRGSVSGERSAQWTGQWHPPRHAYP